MLYSHERKKPWQEACSRSTDVVGLENIRVDTEDVEYRSPMKFAGRPVTSARMIRVMMDVVLRNGDWQTGLGEMPAGDVWGFGGAWPSADPTLEAMSMLAYRLAGTYQGCTEHGHPIDVECALEEDVLSEASQVSSIVGLSNAMPKLAAKVVNSCFSSALFDGFGKAAGANSFRLCTKNEMRHDAAYYLRGIDFPGLSMSQFKGVYPGDFLRKTPQKKVPIYHLVGALDKLKRRDIRSAS